jgi:serine phosphatase RsbU (regulator of sigma subunit)
MQMGLMPARDPIVKGFDVSGVCKPAEEVGGDFFDYFWLDA